MRWRKECSNIMKVCSIASGSSGNCIYLGTEDTHVLFDAGISRKRIEEGLNTAGLSLKDIDAIFVTHEHIDHTKGLGVISRKDGIPIYSTSGTIEGIEQISSLGNIPDGIFNKINADEDISEANEQETADASQKEQEKKETQETQDTESKETQKEDSYEVKLSKADNGLLSFPISEDDLVKADVENSTQSILDASEEDVEYESKDSYEENTEVKVQTSADYGYELDKVELEDKSGEVLQELSVDEEGIATFTMPEENVKVAATF